MTRVYALGPFRLHTQANILFRGVEPVALGHRAVLLLKVLIEQAGAPVSKEALIEAAWPGLAVEDGNLTVQIAALRRVFEQESGGESWIETLPRRGYRYVGPITALTDKGPAAATAVPSTPPLAIPDRPSIAVLAFQNLSGDPEQEYFADGVVEDIITGLSHIKWLFVIARNSSFIYKGKTVDVKRVGQELGVRYVLEGSVRKSGERVRITAQLIDAENASHLWAQRYDRSLDDIFAVQDEITLSVVGAIEPAMRDAEIERVKRKRPDSLDAYDFVLRAMPYLTVTPMPQQANAAMPLLEQALALEPDYARAHGFLAWCHEILFLRGGYKEESRAIALHHAHAAIAHAQDDATALTLGAFVMAMIGTDRVTPFEIFDRALAITPFSSLTLGLGSTAAAYACNVERALDWGERSLRPSPYDQMSYLGHHAMALAYFQLKRYEESAQAAHRAILANPTFSMCYLALAAPLARLGRMEEAKEVTAKILSMHPFSANRFCNAFRMPRKLAEPLAQAWIDAGLPP
jgi:TolB-like protein/tetratricopeptide (TPR) repeat protein